MRINTTSLLRSADISWHDELSQFIIAMVNIWIDYESTSQWDKRTLAEIPYTPANFEAFCNVQCEVSLFIPGLLHLYQACYRSVF